MPLDCPDGPLADSIPCWNRALEGAHPQEVVSFALTEPSIGRLAAVSSFGTESVVLLHMIAQVAPGLPVLFLNTGKLFPETLAYRDTVADRLGLMDVREITPDRQEVFARDPDGVLHVMNPDACCRLRKTEPLEKALKGFGGWFTGRKRYQGASRAEMALFELEPKGQLRVNPLAGWGREEIATYIADHDLPKHPLGSNRMPSLGCLPCTSEVKPGEDARAGRWRGTDKVECGIHVVDGKLVRRDTGPAI